MATVRFTPAFDGDEYHNVEVHITESGEYEVTERMADYLVATFPNRFSAVAPARPEKKTEPKKDKK